MADRTSLVSRWRAAGMLLPTLLAIPALALLLGLGGWQLNRKAWKDALLADIAARASARPMPLDHAMGQLTATHPPAERPPVGEYTRVLAKGRFDHAQERYLFAPHAQLGPGYHVYTPMVVAHGDCSRILIVNRGFVPDALKAPDRRPAGQLGSGSTEPVEVVGLLRLSETPGSFTPSNDVQKNLWFWRDHGGMVRSLSFTPAACPVPFFLDAEAEPANPGGWPRGGTTNLNLPNRHLEYALTWFGLALTLIGVFAAFAMARLHAHAMQRT